MTVMVILAAEINGVCPLETCGLGPGYPTWFGWTSRVPDWSETLISAIGTSEPASNEVVRKIELNNLTFEF